MQIKGQNTKVHFLPQYRQTLLTKLFQVGIPSNWVCFDNNNPEHKKHEHTSQDYQSTLEPSLSESIGKRAPTVPTNSKQGVVLANTSNLSSIITVHHAFRRHSMSESRSGILDPSSSQSLLTTQSDLTDDESVNSIQLTSSKSDSIIPSVEESPKKKSKRKKKDINQVSCKVLA